MVVAQWDCRYVVYLHLEPNQTAVTVGYRIKRTFTKKGFLNLNLLVFVLLKESDHSAAWRV